MRTRNFIAAAVVSSFLSLSAPLVAHHGNAVFDESKYVSVKGIVTEWIWANPHCFLKIDVKDDKGEVSHWIAETSNPPDMLNRGWNKQIFKVGDEVTVIMMTVKNGQPRGRIRKVTLSNGQALSNEGGVNPAIPITTFKQ